VSLFAAKNAGSGSVFSCLFCCAGGVFGSAWPDSLVLCFVDVCVFVCMVCTCGGVCSAKEGEEVW